VPRIAQLVWHVYGYANPKSCAEGLYRRMAALGYQPQRDGRCRGCGAPRDQRTRGCDSCYTRHYYRRRYAARR